ncbi:uncharacterized protein LOC102561138 [Alligator mississippiensis]|uniref:Prolactin-releasing peptide n=1 Tax=Alligator mississippiensis TaxID=8496 RepID=A0A151P2K2_ALLMI|nr:uncharacterized protein LOC102561138 [Alligator mississippiensis]KYO43308.1 prolactin-releasing peptide [Alligator mississippiensis]
MPAAPKCWACFSVEHQSPVEQSLGEQCLYPRPIMWYSVPWSQQSHWSPQSKHLKLVTVYVLVLLVSLSFVTGQSRSFKHQIDNRSPEIDPFWYVGRGVRPIGRFGKRQLRSSQSSLKPGDRGLDLILNALWEPEAMDEEEDDGW